MNQSENIGNLAAALAKTQGMLNGAAKTSDNPFFKSKYADLHECIEASKDALAKNELAVVQTTDTDDKGIWVYTTLVHSSGEWIRGRIMMKPKKDDDQSTGSSITYGRRYGYAAIIGLAQKDDDGNESCGNDKPANGNQPANSQKNNTKQNSVVLEKWLAWVDEFCKPGATLDSFTASLDKYAASIAKLSPADMAKFNIAKNEMVKFLTEREGGKA